MQKDPMTHGTCKTTLLDNRISTITYPHYQNRQFSIDEFFGDVSGWMKDEDCYAFTQG